MIIFKNDQIIAYCGAKVYNKGISCASLDDFVKVFAQDSMLFGLYQGSVGTYRINIIFENNFPQKNGCTCPAMSEYDGVCKHIAGLMILWNKSPSKFIKLETWKNLLATYDRALLMNLIESVARQSIDMTNALHKAILGKALFDYDDIYDPEEW